jgi:hypothetical protein
MGNAILASIGLALVLALASASTGLRADEC